MRFFAKIGHSNSTCEVAEAGLCFMATREGRAISGDGGTIAGAPAVLRWRGIPSWANDPAISNGFINTRADTVAERPAFRAPFKGRRGLIPTTGFYERQATGRKQKQPYHIRMPDGRSLALAGL